MLLEPTLFSFELHKYLVQPSLMITLLQHSQLLSLLRHPTDLGCHILAFFYSDPACPSDIVLSLLTHLLIPLLLSILRRQLCLPHLVFVQVGLVNVQVVVFQAVLGLVDTLWTLEDCILFLMIFFQVFGLFSEDHGTLSGWVFLGGFFRGLDVCFFVDGWELGTFRCLSSALASQLRLLGLLLLLRLAFGLNASHRFVLDARVDSLGTLLLGWSHDAVRVSGFLFVGHQLSVHHVGLGCVLSGQRLLLDFQDFRGFVWILLVFGAFLKWLRRLGLVGCNLLVFLRGDLVGVWLGTVWDVKEVFSTCTFALDTLVVWCQKWILLEGLISLLFCGLWLGVCCLISVNLKYILSFRAVY